MKPWLHASALQAYKKFLKNCGYLAMAAKLVCWPMDKVELGELQLLLCDLRLGFLFSIQLSANGHTCMTCGKLMRRPGFYAGQCRELPILWVSKLPNVGPCYIL